MIEPLRMAFDVQCPVEHAFDLWTQRPSSWWPIDHTVTAEPGLQVVFEGRPGGRIFERTPSGREVEWGEITVWDRLDGFATSGTYELIERTRPKWRSASTTGA